MESKPKIGICMALAEDSVKAKTLFSIVHSLRNVDFEFDMMMNISCDLVGNRSLLVRQAREAKCTHMLFVDHDMFFPPLPNYSTGKHESVISKLLAHDKDIVGAQYNFRSLPLKSTSTPLTDITDKYHLHKAQVVATGLLLIKMSVFDKLEEPYFQFGRDKDWKIVMGEDAWFCQQAIKAGFEVWCDPTLEVRHIGEFLY